jgi:hypothetical protein
VSDKPETDPVTYQPHQKDSFQHINDIQMVAPRRALSIRHQPLSFSSTVTLLHRQHE